MDTRDWITISSVVVVVAGWFVNSWLNRRHETAKQRMGYRLDALLSFLPVLFAAQEHRSNDEKFAKDIASCWTKFQLYCYKNEALAFEKVCLAVQNKDEKAYSESLRQVACIVQTQVRKELGLDYFVTKREQTNA